MKKDFDLHSDAVQYMLSADSILRKHIQKSTIEVAETLKILRKELRSMLTTDFAPGWRKE